MAADRPDPGPPNLGEYVEDHAERLKVEDGVVEADRPLPEIGNNTLDDTPTSRMRALAGAPAGATHVARVSEGDTPTSSENR